MQDQPPQEPPRFAQRFLLWFLKVDLAEEVAGDLAEKYARKLADSSPARAKLDYCYQVLHYLRPFAIRSTLFSDLTPFFMFRNNLKIAWRNLFKQKLYSLINLSGMTLGMTCFVLLSLYVQYESSYDLQHDKSDRIYRVAQVQPGNTFKGGNQFALSPLALAPSIKAEFPEVETATTFSLAQALFGYEDKSAYEHGLFADASLLDVFTYPVLAGNATAALSDPSSIVLTASSAQYYFGKEEAIGKTIQFDNDHLLTVKAVLADPPNNQHFTFSFITSIVNYQSYEEDKMEFQWGSNNYRAYLVLPPGYDYHELDEKLVSINEKAKASGELNSAPEYFLQPLQDIHLHSNLNMEISNNGDIRHVYFAGGIAFIILLLALINYMNLAIARTSLRTKEVGTRKVLGASSSQVAYQFMTESMLVTLLSFGLAVPLSLLFLPTFNQLLELDIVFNLAANRFLLLGLLAISLLLSFGAGIYPAIVSAITHPVQALKGNAVQRKGTGRLLRNALVVSQFVVAIVLGVGSIIVYQQLQFVQNKKLGYNREQIVYIPYQSQHILEKVDILRDELLQHPQVEKFALSNTLPLNSGGRGRARSWEGSKEGDELKIYRNRVDYGFLDLFEMELLEGRNFSTAFPADTIESYLLNESAVAALGWESPVGKRFENGRVIGVVKDFHFQPLDLTIQPMYLRFLDAENLYYQGYISLKINTDNTAGVLAHLKQGMQAVLPEIPFDYRFMDESYDQLYHSEQRFGEAFHVFTFIALFIACIGLFGLVTLSVVYRRKEIGIRKVLGASVGGLLHLITKDFLKLVFLAILIATPLSWWAMRNWLQGFAYRITIDWWVFLLVGFSAMFIAFITLGSQSLRAAIANPVEAIQGT